MNIFNLFTAIVLFISSFTFASSKDATIRPPAFTDQGRKIVFTDFITADYSIAYDVAAKKAVTHSEILFDQVEEGYPMIALKEKPTRVILNGQEVEMPESLHETRFLNQRLPVGRYKVEIDAPLTKLLQFESGAVKQGFWQSDFETGYLFLDQFLPSNFEYDRVKMKFDVTFKNGTQKQVVFANGQVTWLDSNRVKIDYPEYYAFTSPFFHVTTQPGYLTEFYFKSRDGRVLPITIYTNADSAVLQAAKTKAIDVLTNLEADYGAFPHDRVVIYVAGSGGMEYCGATISDVHSLSHELYHSYFARGLMPADGRAGWIDEALASWRDRGYRARVSMESLGYGDLSSHGAYVRSTDYDAYGYGAEFMAYLNSLTASRGGLRSFVQSPFLREKFDVSITVESFVKYMEEFYQMSFMPEFKKYTFSKNNSTRAYFVPSKVHFKRSQKELMSIL